MLPNSRAARRRGSACEGSLRRGAELRRSPQHELAVCAKDAVNAKVSRSKGSRGDLKTRCRRSWFVQSGSRHSHC
jgi:hypothetical protein